MFDSQMGVHPHCLQNGDMKTADGRNYQNRIKFYICIESDRFLSPKNQSTDRMRQSTPRSQHSIYTVWNTCNTPVAHCIGRNRRSKMLTSRVSCIEGVDYWRRDSNSKLNDTRDSHLMQRRRCTNDFNGWLARYWGLRWQAPCTAEAYQQKQTFENKDFCCKLKVFSYQVYKKATSTWNQKMQATVQDKTFDQFIPAFTILFFGFSLIFLQCSFIYLTSQIP